MAQLLHSSSLAGSGFDSPHDNPAYMHALFLAEQYLSCKDSANCEYVACGDQNAHSTELLLADCGLNSVRNCNWQSNHTGDMGNVWLGLCGGETRR